MTSSPPGEAVGGLVSCVLMPESEGVIGVERSTVQLQRIASRCHCQVFYVSYGEVVEGNVPTSTPGSVSKVCMGCEIVCSKSIITY